MMAVRVQACSAPDTLCSTLLPQERRRRPRPRNSTDSCSLRVPAGGKGQMVWLEQAQRH